MDEAHPEPGGIGGGERQRDLLAPSPELAARVRRVERARILISVDLPEPFCPISPCTWPGRTSRSTSRSTVRPPNVFESPRTEMHALSTGAATCVAQPTFQSFRNSARKSVGPYHFHSGCLIVLEEKLSVVKRRIGAVSFFGFAVGSPSRSRTA